MALLSLNIQDRPISSSGQFQRLAGAVRLSFPRVDRALLPGRAFASSVFVHALVVSSLLFWPALYGVPAPNQARNLDAEDDTLSHVIYLPRLGGGSEGNGYDGGGSQIKRKGSPTAPAHSSLGVSYVGAQAILSDPPQPTNRLQTIMRPAVKNPAVLKAFVPAPNIVEMTDAGPMAVSSPVEPARPKLESDIKAPVAPRQVDTKIVAAPAIRATQTPLLTVPTAGPRLPPLPVDSLRAPKAPSLRTDAPPAQQFSPVPTSGPDLENLVSLSPTPAPRAPASEVPAGEARGRFAISPEASPAPTDAEGGSQSEHPGAAAAVGGEEDVRPGNAAGEGQSGVPNGANRLAVGGTGGLGTNAGGGTGSGSGGTGTDRGMGSGTGDKFGSGVGSSPGAGSGPGSAVGGGAFPGVTIAAAGPDSGPGILVAPFASEMVFPVPAALIVNLRSNPVVVSTGAMGGGGLDAYGALKCAKIYTIFLAMPRANWTMQYCQQPASAVQPAPTQYSAVVHFQADAALVPPAPDSESRFDFQRLPVPPEKARKMIVLKGVLREDGTVDALEVYQGVLPQMDEAARLAFSRWKFKPAMRDNKPVAVELLVGIPSELAATK